MGKLTAAWRRFFDVRPGEYRRTVFMGLYLLFVLFSYYILKAASEAMFLNKFDVDDIAYLYVLMAVFGGALAYAYSKVAARTSLSTAVTGTMALSVACLIAMWFPLRGRQPVMLYVFAVWVRMFSVVTVTQGWLVASNLFTPREAKRVYPMLGMGVVLGAIMGGEFSAQTAKRWGTDNLLFASAFLVVLAYIAFRIASQGVPLATVKASEGDETADFTFRDVAADIRRSRHLQVLIMIMTMQFIVDTLIDFQFKGMAKVAYKGDALTAFFGRFYGRYLNITELVLQFFLTTAIVRRMGVGGTLQIMPVTLSVATLGTAIWPSVFTASTARLTEASTRYTLTKTATELFYMPLPRELRNRIKAFIDIFVDRAARGIAGVLLIALKAMKFGGDDVAMRVRVVAVTTIVVTLPWIWLTILAHREYIRTIRRRLESRRLDFESARVTVEDGETIRLLERTAESANARQATYALSLLGQAQGYDPRPLLMRLAGSPQAEVRAAVYRMTTGLGMPGIQDAAMRDASADRPSAATRAAVAYVLSVSPERVELGRKWIGSANPAVQDGVVEALTAKSIEAPDVVPFSWIAAKAEDPDPRQRVLAARVIAARGDQGIEAIHALLEDPDPRVVSAACHAAGALKNRAYVFGIVKQLANYRVRGAAIDALVEYGPVISGTLGDMLADSALPVAVRANIPRVLRRISHQRSVDVLMTAHRHDDPAIRTAALEALARLRHTSPTLNFDDPLLTQHILNEAQHYYELSGLLSVLGSNGNQHGAVGLLARTVEDRRRHAMERMFRLLGLRFGADEMHAAFRAVSSSDKDKHSTGVEYLDSVLPQDLKRVVLPMVESHDGLAEPGRSLFGIEPPSPEQALRSLIESREPWLVACAIAAAGELKLRGLAAEIRSAADEDGEVAPVARKAMEALS